MVIEISKESEYEKYTFSVLKEKKELLNCLNELASKTIIEGLMTKNYLDNRVKFAHNLVFNKLKNSFQEIDKKINSQILNLKIDLASEQSEQEKVFSQSKVLGTHSYAECILSLWLLCLCENHFLSKVNVHPRISLKIKSILIQKNSHLIKNDLTLLALYGSTDSSLEILESLDLISDKNKGLLSDFLDYYRKNSPKRSDYRPNSVYTLREYIFKHGALGPVQYFNFLKVADKLLEETGVDFGTMPIIALLCNYDLVHHKNEPRSYHSLIHFKSREYNSPSKAISLRKTLKLRNDYKYKNLASILKDSKLQIGEKYDFKDNICLSVSEEFEGNLIFSISIKKNKNYLNPEDKDSDFSVKFFELATYQRDFLKQLSLNRRQASLKTYKQGIKLLNEYLVEFVYPITIAEGLPFFDVSGDNFTKSNLAPLFSSSEIIWLNFRKKHKIDKIPLGLKEWLEIEKDESMASYFGWLSAIEKFFKFVEDTSNLIGQRYSSPVPIEFTKSTSKKYFGTTKNILDIQEWLIFIDILNCLMSLGLKEIFLNSDDLDTNFAKEFVKVFDSELLKGKYELRSNLEEDVVYSALSFYRLQYGAINSNDGSLFNKTSFWAAISCLFIVCNTGLRNNSAVNLEFDNLIENKGDKYTSINVIQDKVDTAGFKSMIPTSALNKVLELRKLLLKHDTSFFGLRSIDRGNDVYEKFEGLLGSSEKINEAEVSKVADFVFYLYNEIAEHSNKNFGYPILQKIEILPFINNQLRGNGLNRSSFVPIDAYAISLADIGDKSFEEITSELCPLVKVKFKPDLTVHSIRATFVTMAHISGVSAEIIKSFTGQEPVTQSHYIKASAMNMELLANGSKFELIEKFLRNEPGVRPEELSNNQIAQSINSGVISSGGLSCSIKGILNTNDIESIYRSNFKNISIHSTHICPHNDDCPTYILNILNNEKNCAICPVSISFVSDIPAISQKIQFHIEEAQSLKNGLNSKKRGRKSNDNAWITHFKEASNWLARYDLLKDSNGIIAGENTVRDSEKALKTFRCEDNGLLEDLIRMIESRGYNSYQSGILKAKAMMIQMRLATTLDSLDTQLLINDPVESVCRTLDKILKVNKIGIDEVLKRLSNNLTLLNCNNAIDTFLIGEKNE